MLNTLFYEPTHIIPTAKQRDEAPMMTTTQSQEQCAFLQVIAEVSLFNSADLTQEQSIYSPNLLLF